MTTYRECVFIMAYVEKTCPVCGKEFLVLEKAEEKAVYCTLACLIEAQDKFESRGMAFQGLG
jgi:hypothetical protein